jgi:hypothetical protein
VNEPENTFVNLTMTPEGAVEFIRQLAEDDGFRERFENDTEAALAQHGIHVHPSLIPPKVYAPPKGYLEESLREMGERLARPSDEEAMPRPPFGMPPFSLDSGSYYLVFLALTQVARSRGAAGGEASA